MNDTTQKIAAEAVQRWVIQLRQWLGYDVPERWIESLTTEIQSACEKASRAAHASEQGAWPKQIQQYFKHCDVVFFLKMESELELNQRKGNWRDWNPSRDEIFSELKHHVAKLLDVLETEFDVTEYAADVANLCMKAALSQRPTPATASEP